MDKFMRVFVLADSGKAVDPECMVIFEIWGYGEPEIEDARQDIWDYISEVSLPKSAITAEFKVSNLYLNPEQRSFPEYVDFPAYYEMVLHPETWCDSDGNKKPLESDETRG